MCFNGPEWEQREREGEWKSTPGNGSTIMRREGSDFNFSKHLLGLVSLKDLYFGTHGVLDVTEHACGVLQL